MRTPLRLAAALAVVLSAGLDAQSSRIVGTVTYRERVALTPAAVVDLTLEDVSRADGPPIVIARAHIDHPGTVPIVFELPYDPVRIDAGHRYAVRAEIMDGGRVTFRTADAPLVLTQGHGIDVALMLRAVPGAPA